MFPPGYFDLLDKLGEARKKRRNSRQSVDFGIEEQSWEDIVLPPAPIGINEFSPTPEVKTVFRKRLPDRFLYNSGGLEIVLKNQYLTVIGYYNNFLNVTASANTPYSRQHSIIVGAREIESFATAFEVSLGEKIGGIVDLSTMLSRTIEKSITLPKSKTITDTFRVKPKSGQISVSWWQPVYEYLLEGEHHSIIEVTGQSILPDPFSLKFYNNIPTFIATQYPLASGSDSPLFVAKFADLI